MCAVALVATVSSTVACGSASHGGLFEPSGGDAAPPPASGSHADASIAAAGAAFVRCGDVSCDLGAGQVCCLTLLGGSPVFTCTQGAAGCATTYTCDADNDCTGGRSCCGTSSVFGYTSLACAPACATTEVPVRCTEASDCAGGACCAVLPGGLQSTQFTCRAACSSGEAIACDDSTPCPSGTRCQTNSGVPGGHRICL